MAEEKKIKRPRIDSGRFLEVWVRVANEKGTQADVAEELGCSVAGAYNKFKRLVDQGATLPDLPAGGGRSTIDIKAMNEYIKENLRV